MSRLASLASRRPWRVIIIAILFLGVSVVVGAPLTGNLTAGGFEDKDAEFFQAREQLEEATGASPGPALIALLEPGTDVRAGEGVHAKRGEWVQYSTPEEGGAEYIAVCVPAFSPDTVRRDP